ncbi:hypothetical protein TWF696_007220 [Orbilia brochopaga]|uniref:DUF551 domain-containing protein n=1 Tax=Orbilia brochopaga TaxID=3140254 RepID=A0AAV9UR79_9PEZI
MPRHRKFPQLQPGITPALNGPPVLVPPMEPVDPTPRINELKAMLEDPETDPEQICNIRAVIADLEAGRPTHLCYQDGKGVDVTASDWFKPLWIESAKSYSGWVAH